MATPQEIKQAQDILKQNREAGTPISIRDAITQVKTPTPSTNPITPTPVTPSPTLATNQAQLAENQAKRQEMIQSGSVPAPTTAPTPTPAPIPATPTPAPVAPTPKPEKMEAPIDYTQAKGREQDIVNNLNTFKTQGMTPEQIVKASDYANASPEKKALIEPYLKSTQPTASSLYNIIASKQEVPLEQKNSSAYRVANNRYQRVNQYVGMTPTEVNQAFTDGKMIEGSETWEDLKTLNPKLAQDALNLRKVNGNKTNIFTYVNNPDGTPVKVNKLEQNFADQYNEDHPDIVALIKSVYKTPTYAEMRAQINTPEVISAQDKASSIETEMNSLQTAMDSVDKDVDKEMLGTGATGSRIALEKSVRKADLQKQYDAKLRDYTTAYNKATNLINQNTEMFKYAQEQNKTMQNALAGVYSAQYQAQLGLKTKGAEMQMESDFAKKKAAEALNDPATAISSVMEEMKKIGIPFSESIQTKVASAKDFIANGGTLAGYLDKMQKDIQAKPEFQRYQALQQGQLSDREKLSASQSFDLKKMGMEQNFQMQIAQAKQTTNNKWTKLDDGMYTNEAGKIITADELKSAKLMGNSYITKPAGAEGGDCGFYASRGTGMSATPGGNSKEARIQAFSDKTPQVGGMAFFGGAGYDPTYGHISIVTGVNPDGTITVKESNYGNDQKVTERTVPANTATGYYNNTPLAQGVSGQGTQVSNEAQSWVNAWNNGTMDIETILTKIGTSKEAMPLKNEVIKAIDAQGGVAWRKDNDPMVGKMDDIIDKLDTASKSNYLNTIAGTVQTSLTNFLTGGKSDLLADLKTVIEGGTLQSLIDAKAQGATFGALSNEELKMLQATSSAIAANAIRDPDTKEIIGFKMSESKLKSELEKMKNLFIEKKARMTGAGIKQTPTQATPTTTGGGQTYQGYSIKPF